MPTLEVEQLEMEAIPDSELGKACKKYLSLQNKIKDSKEDLKQIGKEVLNLMQSDRKDCIRFGGFEFVVAEPGEAELKCHPVKGKSENQKKAA